MYGCGAPGALTRAGSVPIEGRYYNRAVSLVPGSELGLRAGAGGAAIGRFGWADPNGVVSNARSSDQDQIGLIVNMCADWRGVYWDEPTGTWRIREGFNLTMIVGAPGFPTVLPNGGDWGQRIYADPIDGTPYAGFVAGLESTRWSVGSRQQIGGLFLLTTWNTPHD